MIPATGHFIWFGKTLPFVYMVGVRSAALNGGFERIVFHCERQLEGSAYWDYLVGTPGIEIRWIESNPFEGLQSANELLEVYQRLDAPAARANMLRVAFLYGEGGVYLDTDTVTVGSMSTLRERFSFFCGLERICFPGGQNAPSGIRGWSRSIGLLGLRDVFRRAPRGWKGFRQVENLYPLAANNAVLGGAPEDPTLRALLDGMVSMPLKEQTVRFALGTHLLQRVVEERGREEGVGLLPPEFFFPIGPEVSQHWFAQSGHSALGEMLHPETRVVHWYASVRTKEVVPLLEPEYILKHREKVPLCALLAPFVES